ncbi:hypothetical protein GF312_06055 [Candidatus Poribacteria bacterium]|nr:hypothetical protein [Candidatus Poribacteria bacterium]
MNRTVLIGLDGATFSVLNPLMQNGTMPFLKDFIGKGVSAILPSVIPPLTPPGWTTIMTGRSPGNHGILDFFRFESPESKYLTFNTARNIECETIWSIVSRHDQKATTLNFPTMIPPQPISGFIVPGWVTWRSLRRSCYPSSLYDKLKEIPDFSIKMLGMDLGTEEQAVSGCPEDEWVEWVKHHIDREKQWFTVLKYMMINEPCELTAIVFDGVDKLQHLFWRFIHPDFMPNEFTPKEQEINKLCMQYFSQMDFFISEIVNLAGDDGRIFMVSDHGFTASSEVFYLNTWLSQNGYLTWSEKAEAHENPYELGVSNAMRYFELIDFEKTTAYSTTPSNRGLYISVAGRKDEFGIPPEKYESFRKELIHKLMQIKDPNSGEQVVKKIWTREEAFAGTAMELAPDLTLDLRDHGFTSILKSDSFIKKRKEITGTHHPEGIFIAGGNGIHKGLKLNEVSILDVVPSLLYSMSIPIPEDLEGKVPVEVFDKEYIRENPVADGPPTTKPEKNTASSKFKQSEEEKAKVMEKLKALGYLE